MSQPVLRHLGAVVADLSLVQRRHQQLHTHTIGAGTVNAQRCGNATLCGNYTVSQKKTRHQTLGHNFTNYYPIFKIFSLADSVVNLQQAHV